MTSNKDKGFVILEEIHTIGFPTKENIDQIIDLADRLQALSDSFHSADQLACLQLQEIVHRMRESLTHHGEIPVKLYAELNRKYIVLKSGLHHHNE
jgi:hypothetical protein